jgi:hypothetical protein
VPSLSASTSVYPQKVVSLPAVQRRPPLPEEQGTDTERQPYTLLPYHILNASSSSSLTTHTFYMKKIGSTFALGERTRSLPFCIPSFAPVFFLLLGPAFPSHSSVSTATCHCTINDFIDLLLIIELFVLWIVHAFLASVGVDVVCIIYMEWNTDCIVANLIRRLSFKLRAKHNRVANEMVFCTRLSFPLRNPRVAALAKLRLKPRSSSSSGLSRVPSWRVCDVDAC